MKKQRFFFSFISYVFFVLLFFTCFSVIAQPGCPNVNAGNDQTLPCNTNCTNLTATFLQTGSTSAYSVSSIPYAPPYAFNTGTAIMVNIDDTWSSAITLPFNFCFFGNNYNQIVVGSNGVITFNTSNAGGYCPWSFSATCPSSSLPTNSIFGVYHDIDPSVSGSLYYAILGSYPCRTFVVNFNQVAMYSSSCNSQKATHQIVLYESTNVIEVYVKTKPLCTSWNSGNAVIGIQNSAGSLGYTPPGRNTSQWTASNEAWRFTPSGPANYALVWLQGTSQIGTTPTINVCPAQTSTYTAQVTYTNCNGSQVVVSDQVVVNRTNPPNVSVTPATSNICMGASQTLTASGASSYSWSPATGLSATTGATVTASPTTTTTYTVTGTASGCTGTANAIVTISGGPTVTLSPFSSVCIGAPAFALTGGSPAGGTFSGSGVSNGIFTPATAGNGTHTITYTYTNMQGCMGTATQALTVFSNVAADAGNNQIICQGQSVNLTAYGGVSYSWSNGSNTQSINVTPNTSTTYTVTVSDANGCSGTDNVTVTVNPAPPANAGNAVNLCTGNSTQLNASGGTTYSWSPATGLNVTNIANPVANPSSSTTYTVTVTNQNGCSATSSVTVSVKPLPVVNVTGSNASCSGVNNATATANVTIGTAPYQYAWSTTPTQTTQTATGLQPNMVYTVTVTDTYGCTASGNVTLSTPAPLAIALTRSDAQCYGSNDGAAQAVVTGGTPPYNYTWLPPGTAGNVNSVNTLSQGSYTFRVADANSCSKDTTFSINQPAQLAFTQNTTHVTCNSGSNGAINLQTQGGTTPYSYTWSNGSSGSASLSNITYGPYTVTVTDAHQCDTVLSFNVNQPPPLTINITPSDTFCIGQTYTIQATASGGTAPYTYFWNNSLPAIPSHTFTAQATTVYSVSITDGQNCPSQTVSSTAFVWPPLNLVLNAQPLNVCQGQSTDLQATVTGGNGGPYNYQWSISGTGPAQHVTPLQNTTYYLTVTDNCGTPPASSQVQIQVYPMPNISFTADTTQGCEPLLVQFTNTTLPTPVTSHWDFGDPQSGALNTSSSVNPFHLYTNAGTYSVSLIVQTAEGCTATFVNNNMIQVYPFPIASFYTNPAEGDMENPIISFINTSVGASGWFWWFGEPSSGSNNISSLENPEHTYLNTGYYNAMLVAISSYGCKDTTYRPVRIKEIFSMYIPNAFSPNSDGLNDNFIPVFSGVQTFNMYIFNRWGEMIYETENTARPWDGTVKNGAEVAMMDVYSYLILVKDINGKEHKYIGHITLLKSDNYNVY